MAQDLSFFWHDYETFGRVPRRDRPAQFAGIRTDADLNEVGDPVMLYCQPPLDALPDPESCLLTGITPQQCQREGVPEHAFAVAIEAQLARPGTVGVGYNTLGFDDEVSRHLFWRNLIDPYAREWQNGCGRWDLLNVVRCAYALRPDGIEWPKHEDGRTSFKLEHLSAANGLLHESAHDALSDVRATIGLARLIRQHQPRLFDFCLRLRKKDAVWAEMGVRRPFLHVSGMYGPDRGCIALVWPVAPHPTNRNEVIVWDLAHSPEALRGLDAEAIRLRMFTRSDQLPEGAERLPLKSIHVNKSPVVIGQLRTLSPAMAERWGVDQAAWERHAGEALALADELAALPWDTVFERPAPETPPDVDQDLYGGFVPPADRRVLERLRTLDGSSLADRHPAFEDGRLDELLWRYRARNWPDSLTDDERERWRQHCHARLHDGRDGGYTLAAYAERIDQLAESLADDDERGQAVLADLVDWAEMVESAD